MRYGIYAMHDDSFGIKHRPKVVERFLSRNPD